MNLIIKQYGQSKQPFWPHLDVLEYHHDYWCQTISNCDFVGQCGITTTGYNDISHQGGQWRL